MKVPPLPVNKGVFESCYVFLNQSLPFEPLADYSLSTNGVDVVLTAKGYVGSGRPPFEAHFEPGDLVCVLFGCASIMVL